MFVVPVNLYSLGKCISNKNLVKILYSLSFQIQLVSKGFMCFQMQHPTQKTKKSSTRKKTKAQRKPYRILLSRKGVMESHITFRFVGFIANKNGKWTTAGNVIM